MLRKAASSFTEQHGNEWPMHSDPGNSWGSLYGCTSVNVPTDYSADVPGEVGPVSLCAWHFYPGNTSAVFSSVALQGSQFGRELSRV